MEILISRTQLAGMIDHTLLRPNTTVDDVRNACNEAVQCGFASVVVNPAHVAIAVKAVHGSPVKVCSVLSFPFGLSTSDTKVYEARAVLERGAQELDMVMNFSALRSGDATLVLQDIRAVVDEAKRHTRRVVVKVILENCYLSDEQKRQACSLVVEAQADYVKTSTGFGTGGATVEDVRLMRETVGPRFGVKAAGGVKTLEQALAMIDAGANRLGTSSSVSIIERLGS